MGAGPTGLRPARSMRPLLATARRTDEQGAPPPHTPASRSNSRPACGSPTGGSPPGVGQLSFAGWVSFRLPLAHSSPKARSCARFSPTSASPRSLHASRPPERRPNRSSPGSPKDRSRPPAARPPGLRGWRRCAPAAESGAFHRPGPHSKPHRNPPRGRPTRDALLCRPGQPTGDGSRAYPLGKVIRLERLSARRAGLPRQGAAGRDSVAGVAAGDEDTPIEDLHVPRPDPLFFRNAVVPPPLNGARVFTIRPWSHD